METDGRTPAKVAEENAMWILRPVHPADLAARHIQPGTEDG